MTDKQIIIDGVDVSGCPYYIDSEGGCSSHDCECIKCVHNVCFYKDYKAKEQECEELKIYIESNEQQVKEVETLVMDNDRLINELDQLKEQLEAYTMEAEEGKEINAELKAENDELEEELAKVRMEICNQCGEKDDYNIPCKQIRDLDYGLQLEIKENNKLKQTLTEIKEIAEKQCVCGVDCIDIKQILQKISECEENDE